MSALPPGSNLGAPIAKIGTPSDGTPNIIIALPHASTRGLYRNGSVRVPVGPKIGAPGTTIVLQTQAPQPGSPAIGKGITSGAPPTDECGFQSVVNGKINVGAVSQTGQDDDDVMHQIRGHRGPGRPRGAIPRGDLAANV